jgi:hypothetical protein
MFEQLECGIAVSLAAGHTPSLSLSLSTTTTTTTTAVDIYKHRRTVYSNLSKILLAFLFSTYVLTEVPCFTVSSLLGTDRNTR